MAERVFADTNLFLRYLTNDIPKLADAFERILIQARNGEVILVVNSLVIAEIVWTLESYYSLEPSDVQEKVLAILNTPGVEIGDGDIVVQAILWHVEKGVDFIDAYNAAWMVDGGINTIVTFDRKHFSRFEDVKVVVPSD
jgi:predicted nucleic acid-binding protein